MATHSSVLAWRIPGTEKPGGLPSMGLRRVRHDWSDLAAAAAAPPPHSTGPCNHRSVLSPSRDDAAFLWRGRRWPLSAGSVELNRGVRPGMLTARVAVRRESRAILFLWLWSMCLCGGVCMCACLYVCVYVSVCECLCVCVETLSWRDMADSLLCM